MPISAGATAPNPAANNSNTVTPPPPLTEAGREAFAQVKANKFAVAKWFDDLRFNVASKATNTMQPDGGPGPMVSPLVTLGVQSGALFPNEYPAFFNTPVIPYTGDPRAKRFEQLASVANAKAPPGGAQLDGPITNADLAAAIEAVHVQKETDTKALAQGSGATGPVG